MRRPFKAGLYRSYIDEDLRRTDDVDIFPVLQQRGFTAIITQDRNQLFYEEERRGLREAGLHWVGLVDVKGKGIRFHSQALSALATVLPDLIGSTLATPHAFYVTPDHSKALRTVVAEPI
ncbi:hypothetical protein [Microbacterium sp. A1-JK]|uniref:hypothetical protein n=1 Tax=Microbacterium sp. A1-JK TaxID=3177516 RepID=UPI003886E8BB